MSDNLCLEKFPFWAQNVEKTNIFIGGVFGCWCVLISLLPGFLPPSAFCEGEGTFFFFTRQLVGRRVSSAQQTLEIRRLFLVSASEVSQLFFLLFSLFLPENDKPSFLELLIWSQSFENPSACCLCFVYRPPYRPSRL